LFAVSAAWADDTFNHVRALAPWPAILKNRLPSGFAQCVAPD